MDRATECMLRMRFSIRDQEQLTVALVLPGCCYEELQCLQGDRGETTAVGHMNERHSLFRKKEAMEI